MAEPDEHRKACWRPNPEVVTAVGRSHPLHCVSGTVIGRSAVADARVHDNEPHRPGRDERVFVAPERAAPAVVHDELLLLDPDGREHSFQLDELQVAARFGDAVSVLSAGGEQGPVIAVKNHCSESTYFNEEALLRIFLREPAGVLWTALLICTCFTPLIFGVPWTLLKRARARRAIAKFKDELQFVPAA